MQLMTSKRNRESRRAQPLALWLAGVLLLLFLGGSSGAAVHQPGLALRSALPTPARAGSTPTPTASPSPTPSPTPAQPPAGLRGCHRGPLA